MLNRDLENNVTEKLLKVMKKPSIQSHDESETKF